jgi:hypothetical protein
VIRRSSVSLPHGSGGGRGSGFNNTDKGRGELLLYAFARRRT